MDSMVQVIRAVVRDELKALRLGEVGKVTSVFPIDDPEGSTDNYACSIELRERGVELRKVPMCTPNVGMVSTPYVGDLVLVAFVGGDPNAPVVIGRLHSEETRPPAHEEGELVIEVPHTEDTRLCFKPDGSIVATAKDAEITMQTDGLVQVKCVDVTVETEGKIDVTSKDAVNLTTDKDCIIKAAGNIELGESGSGVITVDSHKCYFTGAPLVGSDTVKAKL